MNKKRANRKPNILLKMTLREIKSSFGRFFAVLAIIAIGTGFFSGVRITTPVMVHTVDQYYRDNQLYDYRALSTIGWEKEEVGKLSEEENVRSAEGSWQYDVLCKTDDGSTGVYKVHSITQNINSLQLTEGRMPAAGDECILDTRNRCGLGLGDSIHFSEENESDTLEAFSYTTYTVVGFAESSLYINFERGTTSLGNGTVLGFMYLPKSSFSADYYTDIYVKLDSDPVIYSDAYKDRMDDLRPKWEDLVQSTADDRYTRLYNDADQELQDARKKFEDKKAEGEQELGDAAKELADGKKELDDAAKELEDGKKELDDAATELSDGKKKLDDAAKELEDGKKELDSNAVKLSDAEKELNSAKSQLDEGGLQLDDAADQLISSGDQLSSALEEIENGEAELIAGGAELDEAAAQLYESEIQLAAAEQQLSESESQLDAAWQQLSESKAVLDETQAALDDAEAQLASGKAELDETAIRLTQSEAALNASQEELDRQQVELSMAYAVGFINEEAYLAAQAELDAAQYELDAYRAEYESGAAAYEAGLAEYEAHKAEYEAGKAAYETGLAQYQAGLSEYEAGKAAYEQGVAEYEAGRAAYEQGAAEYEAGRAAYDAAVEEYEAGVAEYNDGVSQYNDGLAAYYDALEEYEAGVAEYNDGLAEYISGKEQYDQGVQDYKDGKAEYEKAAADYESGKKDYDQGLLDYEEGLQEYKDGLVEYEDGVAEYEDAKKTYDTEIADAEKKLQDAEDELADFEKPDTYLLERSTNIAYACFESDSEIVKQVARVLPLFFILVAVLVCMTTMTRMVDERRGQIGILKGLGYSGRDIMMTFMLYSGTAAILGCIIGYAIGVVLFPAVIWFAYEMMYNSIPIRFLTNWKLATIVFIVSLASTLGTTYISCRSEMSESAASLLRPKAPKAGKRVFLEYIPAIWSRMKFMHKVSVRNIFRYKKRFFMMVVGISGCTALLLTGFGLKDSIAAFVDTQYEEIQVAKAELLMEETEGDSLPEDLTKTLKELDASCFPYQQTSWDLQLEDRVKGVTVIVPQDWSDIDSYFRLKDMDGEKIPKAGPGEALVSISISRRYGLSVGDKIRLRNEDMQTIEATVAGVFENHVYNYVFLSKETMKDATGRYYQNGAYVNIPDGRDIYEAQAELDKCDSVVSVSVFADFRERIANMMSSLNYVILVIILSAAALAFVVLYNLTNINIIERIREIATIKVLGFYRNETSNYVFRENILLTTFGMFAGLGLGVLLHGFVIDQIVVDLVYFRKEITPMSFLFSILLTFSFTFAVNQIMAIKLDKINMAESLKSIE